MAATSSRHSKGNQSPRLSIFLSFSCCSHKTKEQGTKPNTPAIQHALLQKEVPPTRRVLKYGPEVRKRHCKACAMVSFHVPVPPAGHDLSDEHPRARDNMPRLCSLLHRLGPSAPGEDGAKRIILLLSKRSRRPEPDLLLTYIGGAISIGCSSAPAACLCQHSQNPNARVHPFPKGLTSALPSPRGPNTKHLCHAI